MKPDFSRLPAAARWAAREPLAHFAALGALIFAVYLATHPMAASDERTIVVDRQQLLTFLQYRSKEFDQQHFATVLDTMSPKALQDLVDAYVQEEAMYREAKSLKLDQHDYVARRRLVQQLEFATQGLVADRKPPTDAEVAAYYEAHKADYTEEPSLTFAHVFFDSAKHGEGTEVLARAELGRLNADRTPFSQAMAHGDRPLYDVNYVQRDIGAVASDFGAPMARRLLALTPSADRWQGPFESKYGFELVMLTEVEKGGAPPLDAIRERVRQDAAEADKKAHLGAAVAAIVQAYRVRTLGALQHPPAKAGP